MKSIFLLWFYEFHSIHFENFVFHHTKGWLFLEIRWRILKLWFFTSCFCFIEINILILKILILTLSSFNIRLLCFSWNLLQASIDRFNKRNYEFNDELKCMPENNKSTNTNYYPTHIKSIIFILIFFIYNEECNTNLDNN